MLAVVVRLHARMLALFGLLAGISVAAIALLVTANVFLRNLGITNFPWLLEVSEYVLFIATFMAAPWVLRVGAHVRVDLLLGLVPGAGARALTAIADVAGLVFCLLLSRHGWNVAAEAFVRGDKLFKELVIPEWPLLAVIPVSGCLLAIEFSRRLLTARTEHKGEAAASPMDGL